MVKYNVVESRRRKQMRRNFIKKVGKDGMDVFFKGVDAELNNSFPSCKMFFNTKIENNFLVIYVPQGMKHQIRSIIKCSTKMPKFFALDVLVREI